MDRVVLEETVNQEDLKGFEAKYAEEIRKRGKPEVKSG